MEKTDTVENTVLWLQCASCTGCSVSVLNSVSPGIQNVLLDKTIPGSHISLRFHSTLMAGAGEAVIRQIESTAAKNQGGYILVVEGAIPAAGNNGNYGSIGEHNGSKVSMYERVISLGQNARVIIALGTCAAFGGIPAAEPNPTRSTGVDSILKKCEISTPLINIPGCPPHPDWFIGILVQILMSGLPGSLELDENKRPKAFYGQLIHENCPRRAYFDEGKFAKAYSEPGCLNELGCKGPITYADCPTRHWNNGVNWCIGSRSPCIGCVEPGFPDLVSPLNQKLTANILPNIASCGHPVTEPAPY